MKLNQPSHEYRRGIILPRKRFISRYTSSYLLSKLEVLLLSKLNQIKFIINIKIYMCWKLISLWSRVNMTLNVRFHQCCWQCFCWKYFNFFEKTAFTFVSVIFLKENTILGAFVIPTPFLSELFSGKISFMREKKKIDINISRNCAILGTPKYHTNIRAFHYKYSFLPFR